MRTMTRGWLLLAMVGITAGFPSCGANVKPTVCPNVQPLPQKLQDKTDYAARVRRELFGTSNQSSPSETK